MACRKLILVATLLWLMAGSHAWADSAAPEDAKEAESGGVLARISGTAKDVVAGAQGAVSETLDDAVSTVEETLLDSSVDELVYDTTTNVWDTVALAVDDVVEGVEDTVWDPLQGMLGDEGAVVPDTPIVPMGYKASVASGTATAGIVTDIAPEARDYLLVQVGGAQAAIKELQTVDVDGAVIGAANMCHDYVLVPVDDVGSFIVASYAHAATGLTSTVLEPVGNMVTGTLATTMVSLEDSGIGNRVGEAVADAAGQTQQVLDAAGEWVDTEALQFGASEDVVLDGQKVDVATGLIAGSMAGTSTRVARATASAANTWDSLSKATMQKFKRRGLRNGMASRTDDMARELYETVPQSVRAGGEDAVKEFLGKYELSHIKSIRDYPEKAYDLDNVIWEAGELNRRRGANTMKPDEIRVAQEALEQEELLALDKLDRKFGLKSLGRGLAWGAIAEVPIVTLENLLHVHHGRMTPEEAIRDGVNVTALNLGVGAVASGVAYVLASAGVTATVGPAAAVPIMVGGAVLYAGHAVYRLCRAAQPELREPLYPEGLALVR